jgi:SAM-dependent methyltransferase
MAGDVLEHLRDPGAFLRRLHPLLKPGGRLVVSTPNVANWTNRLGLLAGRWDYHPKAGILNEGHTYLFTLGSLHRTLTESGFRLEVLDYTVPVPVLGRLRPVESLAHWLGRLRPSLLAYQFVVAATKR